MKVKEGFLLKEVAGSYVIVPIGDNLVDFSAMITTNATGAFLWNLLQEDTDIGRLTDAVTAEFAIDRETAKQDIEEFVALLSEKKVLG